MKAVVLAGGKGERLMPLTKEVPKVMLPLRGKPVLEHILLNLKGSGISECILTTGYKGRKISEYFGNGDNLGIKISYSHEEKLLGTAGCLNPLKDELKETFILYGGDNITDLDLRKLVKFHKESGGMLTVALFRHNVKIPWGIYEIGGNGLVKGFREKPVYTYNAGTMIFCMEPEIFRYIPERHEGVLNITDHVIPELLKNGEKVFGYPFSGKWVDIGSPEIYRRENSG